MRDLQEVVDALLGFRDERDWGQFHNPKDLAVSVAIEAGELLEAFQWSGTDVSGSGREARVREELADVLIYCLYLADAMGIDAIEAIEEKMAVNRSKYPMDRSRGTSRKYTEL